MRNLLPSIAFSSINLSDASSSTKKQENKGGEGFLAAHISIRRRILLFVSFFSFRQFFFLFVSFFSCILLFVSFFFLQGWERVASTHIETTTFDSVFLHQLGDAVLLPLPSFLTPLPAGPATPPPCSLPASCRVAVAQSGDGCAHIFYS